MNFMKGVKTTMIKSNKEYFWISQPTYKKEQISLFLQEKSVAKNYFFILWNMSCPREAEPGNRRRMETEKPIRMCNSFTMLQCAVTEFKKEPLLSCCQCPEMLNNKSITFLKTQKLNRCLLGIQKNNFPHL